MWWRLSLLIQLRTNQTPIDRKASVAAELHGDAVILSKPSGKFRSPSARIAPSETRRMRRTHNKQGEHVTAAASL